MEMFDTTGSAIYIYEPGNMTRYILTTVDTDGTFAGGTTIVTIVSPKTYADSYVLQRGIDQILHASYLLEKFPRLKGRPGDALPLFELIAYALDRPFSLESFKEVFEIDDRTLAGIRR